MYECPNCNGNLKFYIPTQMLRCDYCNTEMDPYAFQKERDAVEDSYFETTVFTCPECGGELLSTDNEATAFCSFCGGATILDSRISREKRPDSILPFRKTKEDCKEAYIAMMRHAPFTPKAFKKIEHIDGFRGIYMPYWIYHISQKGFIGLDGKRQHRSGNYIITDSYDLTGYLDAEYDGLSRDASSSFADNMSEAIAPFDVNKRKPFTPSFLSGFYADTADVDHKLYQNDVAGIATAATMKELFKVREFGIYLPEGGAVNENVARKLNTRVESVDRAMFPVWFLSYRNGDRIAYATVNGQTGKVAADLPVDPKRYLLGSLLLAVPIFLLLHLFLTLRPTLLLAIASILALVTLLLYSAELTQIIRRDSGEDDKGLLFRKKGSVSAVNDAVGKKGFESNVIPFKDVEKAASNSFVKIMFRIVFFMWLFPFIFTFLWNALVAPSILCIVLLIAGVIMSVTCHRKLGKLSISKKRYGYIGSTAALIIAAAIFWINPVADAYYYGGAVATIFAVFFTISNLIYYYNILATRKLPQFDRSGGDDRA